MQLSQQNPSMQLSVHRHAIGLSARVFGFFLFLFSIQAVAQVPSAGYPAKPIRLIVPFTPGGSTDILSRLVAQRLTETWGAGSKTFGIENGVIVEVKEEKGANGKVEKYAFSLCNFQARIEADTMRDDGIEQTAVFTLSGSLATGEVLPTRDVPAAQFGGMSWVTSVWASRAVVYSGQATKDKLREAIQLRGIDSRPSSIVYSHTGWRKLEPHGWVYLHAAGGIGKDGSVPSIKVQLTGSLERYALPASSRSSLILGCSIVGCSRSNIVTFEIAPHTTARPCTARDVNKPLAWSGVIARDCHAFQVPTGFLSLPIGITDQPRERYSSA